MADRPSLQATADAPRDTGVSIRSVAAGVVGVVIVAIGFPYVEYVVQGTRPANTAIPFGVIFLFAVVVATLNPLLAFICKRWQLQRSELLVIFVMLLIASAIPTWGLIGQLIPIISGAQYYASPENRWQLQVIDRLPDWMVVKHQDSVNTFYEGLSPGEAIPWGPWITPLLAWSVFVFGLYAATLGVTLLFHRQWAEHEKLVYPLMQLPLEMVREVTPERRIGSIFSSPLMWIGFGAAFLLSSYVAFAHYWPPLPALKLRTFMNVPIQNETIALRLWTNPSVTAFTYFIHTDLAFSLWFFSLVGQFQDTIMRMYGVSLGAKEIYGAGSPAVSNQAMGAMIVLVVYGIYTARQPLSELLRSAWEGRSGPRDRHDIISPRLIVGSLVIGFGTMIVWLYLAGLNLLTAVVFLFAAFVTFTALTRATIQGGVPVSRAALVPQSFAATVLGSRYVGATGMASLATSFSWGADIRVFMMPFLAHAAKLWSEIEGPRRGFVWILAICIGLCAVLSTLVTLYFGYSDGAVWMSSWLFSGCPQAAYRFAVNHMEDLQGPSWSKMAYLGVGGVVMWLLTALHYYWPRWPLHPLGFAVGSTTPVNDLWLSIFYGWLAKWLTLRLGGYRAYRAGILLFMGVVLGQFTAVSVWAIVDGIAGVTSNMIYIY